MAATRPRLVAGGGWLADTVADLFLISARHGDDAFVVETKVWYKYASSTGMWHQVSFGVATVTDLPVVLDDGEVILDSYTFLNS
jgi:hypothetical protein